MDGIKQPNEAERVSLAVDRPTRVGDKMQTGFRKFVNGFQAEVLVPEDIQNDDDRRNARHASQQHGTIGFRGVRVICDLVDLSETGAKISVGDGIVPNVGENVTLTLFDGSTINGEISWLRDKHIGVEFQHAIPNIDERLDFENLGRDFFGKAVTLQKSTRGP
jgi:hypothetical protein